MTKDEILKLGKSGFVERDKEEVYWDSTDSFGCTVCWGCKECTNCSYSWGCIGSTDLEDCSYCTGSSDCFLCTNLIDEQYMVLNIQLTEDVYFDFMSR